MYLTLGLVVGIESIGVPLPGETLLVAAALLAGQDVVSPVLVAVSAGLGAVVATAADQQAAYFATLPRV